MFVTPESNHYTSGVLKNAIDYLYQEWNNKAAGFVSYGASAGARAVEHLRLIATELQIATVGEQVTLSLYTDFDEDGTRLHAAAFQTATLDRMFDQLTAWSGALRDVRLTSRLTSV